MGPNKSIMSVSKQAVDVEYASVGTTYHWAESVGGFANVELLVVALALSRRHVVDDGVAPNIVHGFILPDAEAFLTDDDAELALVIGGLGELGVRVDVLAVCDDGCEAL